MFVARHLPDGPLDGLPTPGCFSVAALQDRVSGAGAFLFPIDPSLRTLKTGKKTCRYPPSLDLDLLSSRRCFDLVSSNRHAQSAFLDTFLQPGLAQHHMYHGLGIGSFDYQVGGFFFQ